MNEQFYLIRNSSLASSASCSISFVSDITPNGALPYTPWFKVPRSAFDYLVINQWDYITLQSSERIKTKSDSSKEKGKISIYIMNNYTSPLSKNIEKVLVSLKKVLSYFSQKAHSYVSGYRSCPFKRYYFV